jgi:hypothetical protein
MVNTGPGKTRDPEDPMKPRLFAQVILLTLTLAGGALAQGYADDVVRQLGGQGYADISVSTTFLGRVRILAKGEGGHREIILNPRTGEILRDLWIVAGGATPKVTIVNPSAAGGGSDSGSDDDNSGPGGGDDDDDDGGSSGSDDDDDNSGSGGGDDDSDDDRDDDRNDDRDDDRNDDRDGKDD